MGLQSFITFDSMYRAKSVTIHWKAVEQYFTAVLFIFYPVCNFENFINVGPKTVKSEKVIKLNVTGMYFVHYQHVRT